MRISSRNQSLRGWGEFVEYARQMQTDKDLAIAKALAELIERNHEKKVKPLDSNVIGGPLDGTKIPNGTRPGLKYEWDGKRWRHVN